MTSMWSKWYIMGCVAFAILSTILVFAFIFIPNLHVNKLKKDLNNEIINNDYLNWVQVDIDTNISIRLPETWILQSSHDDMLIMNDSGAVIAIGIKKETFSKGDTTEFLGEYYGSRVISYQTEVMGTGNYGNSASAHITSSQHEDGSRHEQIILYLPFYNKYKYRFCFFSADYAKEVAAIAWSMKYN